MTSKAPDPQDILRMIAEQMMKQSGHLTSFERDAGMAEDLARAGAAAGLDAAMRDASVEALVITGSGFSNGAQQGVALTSGMRMSLAVQAAVVNDVVPKMVALPHLRFRTKLRHSLRILRGIWFPKRNSLRSS